jgi:transcriptional regulator with XRE-family HTH domain
MTLGKKIESLRKERKWSQVKLADAIGVSVNHLSRWENNRIRPRNRSLESLSKVFGVELAEFVEAKNTTFHPTAPEPELGEILDDIRQLDDEQRNVLKFVVQSMLTCKQLENLASRPRVKANPYKQVV